MKNMRGDEEIVVHQLCRPIPVGFDAADLAGRKENQLRARFGKKVLYLPIVGQVRFIGGSADNSLESGIVQALAQRRPNHGVAAGYIDSRGPSHDSSSGT